MNNLFVGCGELLRAEGKHFQAPSLTLWRRNFFFFLILEHPLYKMWIIQEPNKLALWNKLHFEERKTESVEHV